MRAHAERVPGLVRRVFLMQASQSPSRFSPSRKMNSKLGLDPYQWARHRSGS